MLTGIINVYKEKGYTSFDVVAKLRGILHMKKIGHTGTLDPDAEGVLPVCLGKATKVCEMLTDRQKEYETVMLLGTETDTQDVSGKVLAQMPVTVSEDEVRAAAGSFVGDYMQVPPMYSALKVNGKKLCDLARAGVTVERQPRCVIIHELEVLRVELPRVLMRVRCSKGTYIRTLCRDIGEKLSCGACMESLVRTRVSGFALDTALKLSELEKKVPECAGAIAPEQWETDMFPFILPVAKLFPDYPHATVASKYQKLLYNGNRLLPKYFTDYDAAWERTPLLVYDVGGNLAGIYGYRAQQKDYRPEKMLL